MSYEITSIIQSTSPKMFIVEAYPQKLYDKYLSFSLTIHFYLF